MSGNGESRARGPGSQGYGSPTSPGDITPAKGSGVVVSVTPGKVSDPVAPTAAQQMWAAGLRTGYGHGYEDGWAAGYGAAMRIVAEDWFLGGAA